MTDNETKIIDIKKDKEIEIDENKAIEILEKSKQERIKRCQEKIQQILNEENCILEASILITSQGNIPQINIIARGNNG